MSCNMQELYYQYLEYQSLLGRAQPVIPPNLYSLFINIKAWGPQVIYNKLEKSAARA